MQNTIGHMKKSDSTMTALFEHVYNPRRQTIAFPFTPQGVSVGS